MRFVKNLSIIMSSFAVCAGLPAPSWAEGAAAPSSCSVGAGGLSAEVGSSGAARLSWTDGEGDTRDLLTSADGAPSFVSVIAGGREFRSCAPGVERSVSSSAVGGKSCALSFSVPGRFSATLTLSPAGAEESVWLAGTEEGGGQPSCLRAELSLTNESGARCPFSLRAFFDTSLGDSSDVQFEGAGGAEFRAEGALSGEELRREAALRSTDGESFLGFSFADLPTSAVVANRDVLLRAVSASGGLRGVDGRSFSSASSYLNSAVALSWDGLLVEDGDTRKVAFFLSAGAVNRNVRTLVRWAGPTPDETSDGAKAGPAAGSPAPAPSPAAAASPAAAGTKPDKPAEEAKPRADVDFTVSNLKDYQLDPSYVQALVDRINSLRSETGEPIDRDEIRRLNAELDAILSKLRQEQGR